jgi:hypothetical protein
MTEEDTNVVVYNVQHLCRYKNDELSCHLYNEESLLDAIDELYRQDLLSIFMMTEFDETIITGTLSQIHALLVKNDTACPFVNKFVEYANTTAHTVMSTDSSVGLMLLYSFDYMNKCHACISYFLQFGKMTEENTSDLLNC